MPVRVRQQEQTRIPTFSNPGKPNAFPPEMLRDMASAVRAADADEDVRVIVITGEGDAFCAGGYVTSTDSDLEAFEHLDISTMTCTPCRSPWWPARSPPSR